jgi:hypothetical protein
VKHKDDKRKYGRTIKNSSVRVMVWGGIHFFFATPLIFVNGTLNKVHYVKMLSDHIVPLLRDVMGTHGIPVAFQQDNAKPHTAQYTRDWLAQQFFRTITFPACSPDLSPIEKVWATWSSWLTKRTAQRRSSFGPPSHRPGWSPLPPFTAAN